MCITLAWGCKERIVIQSTEQSIQDHRSVTQFRFYQQKSDEEKNERKKETVEIHSKCVEIHSKIRKSQSFNQNNGEDVVIVIVNVNSISCAAAVIFSNVS